MKAKQASNRVHVVRSPDKAAYTPTPAANTANTQIIRTLAKISDRLKRSEAERYELLGELREYQKTLRALEDRAENSEKAYLNFEHRLKTRSHVEDDVSLRQARFEKALKDTEEKLIKAVAGQAVVDKRIAESDARFTSVNQRLDDTIQAQSRIDRQIEKAAQEKARMARKIERLEEVVIETQEALRARAMVLLTDQTAPGKTHLPSLPAWADTPAIEHGSDGDVPWWRKSIQMQSVGMAAMILAALFGGWMINQAQQPSIPQIAILEDGGLARLNLPDGKWERVVPGTEENLALIPPTETKPSKPFTPDLAEHATAPMQAVEPNRFLQRIKNAVQKFFAFSKKNVENLTNTNRKPLTHTVQVQPALPEVTPSETVDPTITIEGGQNNTLPQETQQVEQTEDVKESESSAPFTPETKPEDIKEDIKSETKDTPATDKDSRAEESKTKININDDSTLLAALDNNAQALATKMNDIAPAAAGALNAINEPNETIYSEPFVKNFTQVAFIQDPQTVEIIRDSKPVTPPQARLDADTTLPAAIKEVETQAFAGDSSAQHNLAALYTSGDNGVAQNFARAAFWYREAAENGVANAQYNLGVLYHQGLGVPRDLKQALYWYREAAKQGQKEAQYNLGIAYIEGIGTAYDPALAGAFFRRAADQGVVEAAYNLGLIYENNLLEREAQQPEQALLWYKIAADNGNLDAKNALREMAANLQIGMEDVDRLVLRLQSINKDVTGRKLGPVTTP